MLTRYFTNEGSAAGLQTQDWGPFGLNHFFLNSPQKAPSAPLNLYATENSYIVTTEIPGVNPEKLSITAEDSVVTIKGTFEQDVVPDGAELFRRERGYGDFTRSIRLPFIVDESSVSAKAANGVLRLEIAKPAEQKPIRIPIKTE